MFGCWLGCDFVAYDKDTSDGGYVTGLHCERCDERRPVVRVSKKGAQIQKELDHMRKNGYDSRDSAKFYALLQEFRREVTRI